MILWSLCSVVFHALTLKLPIQTSHSVAPKLQVSLRSDEKCEQFNKMSTALDLSTRFEIVPVFLFTTSILTQGCARFPDFVKNFSDRQILRILCSVDFYNFTLQLPIQTPHSVAPELPVFVSSLENFQNFSKTSTPQGCARFS